MRIQRLWLVIVLFAALTACGNDKVSEYASDAKGAELGSKADTSKSRGFTKYLAYRHQIDVELPTKKLPEVHNKLVKNCEQDQSYKCVVLDARLNTGSSPNSQIKLRLKREGVSHFSTLASTEGTIAARSTSAEDLSESIVDSAKRIEMLKSYRDRLQLLEAIPNSDIDSLVKIASELASVQSELEFAQGKREKLLQRVETDILNISLFVPYSSTVGSPIKEALSNFIYDFKDGISSVISATAYLIPWTFFLIVFFLFLRLVYRIIRKQKVS